MKREKDFKSSRAALPKGSLLASFRRCTKLAPSLTISENFPGRHAPAVPPLSSRVPLNLIREQEKELRIVGELVVELRQQVAACCLVAGARPRQTGA